MTCTDKAVRPICLCAIRCVRPTSSLVGDGCRSRDLETTSLPGVPFPFDALAGRLVPIAVPIPRFDPRPDRCRCRHRPRHGCCSTSRIRLEISRLPVLFAPCLPCLPGMFQPGGVLGVCPTESDRPRASTALLDVAIVGRTCPSFPWPSRRCRFASDSVLSWVFKPTAIG